MWVCSCNCGGSNISAGRDLKNGKVKSCGCLRKELIINRNKSWVGKAAPNRVDLSDKKFGKLSVIEYAYTKNGAIFWRCRCDCSKIVTVRGRSLADNNTKSCGCLRSEIVKNASRVGITGQRFGRLFALDYAYTKNKKAYWRCRCDCGGEVVTAGVFLRNKNTKSCGCLKKEGQCGSSHPNWNPDREYVESRAKVYSIMKKYLRRLSYNKKGKHTEEILGYTKEQFKNHLESKFLPGMSWNNHGNGEGHWHIDHIKPVSLFVKEGVTDPKIINNLDNLQPLWAIDNLRKGASY